MTQEADLKVVIQDLFWSKYRKLVKTEMIPYQWNVLNDKANVKIEKERSDGDSPSEKSHAIENFKIAAGRTTGEHYGWVFQDSDVYKWLEAVAYSLRTYPDQELQKIAEETFDLIGEAQEEDGYLDTYFTLKEPERKFKRLAESHELYCAGHFMEAAVAFFQVTGEKKVLEIACKLADCIAQNFGENKKVHGFDGHEEIEIGLMKLYRMTKNTKYLDLANYFIKVRGTLPAFFEEQRKADPGADILGGIYQAPLSYFQADVSPIEQTTARGHAVRQVYLLTAMADLAAETNDSRMLDACQRVWRNIVDKQLYITGGIGATVNGEAFTLDYDLPNDTMYCETCASVGLVFFASQMLRSALKGEYADVMERALYNTVLASMALDGRHFFYVNPLEVVPEKTQKDPGKTHVKCIRPSWLGCACCPPNLARLLAGLEQYIYTQKKETIAVNLFIESTGTFSLSNGELTIVQKTQYPEHGKTELLLDCSGDASAQIAIRLPGGIESYTMQINGETIAIEPQDGYLYIQKHFEKDVVTLQFEWKTQIWHSHPYVRSNIGKIAVSRGPFIYCIEEVDNGKHLEMLSIPSENTAYEYQIEEGVLGRIGTLTVMGHRKILKNNTSLYQSATEKMYEVEKTNIKLIPYYAWANRGENEMSVWIREE